MKISFFFWIFSLHFGNNNWFLKVYPLRVFHTLFDQLFEQISKLKKSWYHYYIIQTQTIKNFPLDTPQEHRSPQNPKQTFQNNLSIDHQDILDPFRFLFYTKLIQFIIMQAYSECSLIRKKVHSGIHCFSVLLQVLSSSPHLAQLFIYYMYTNIIKWGVVFLLELNLLILAILEYMKCRYFFSIILKIRAHNFLKKEVLCQV